MRAMRALLISALSRRARPSPLQSVRLWHFVIKLRHHENFVKGANVIMGRNRRAASVKRACTFSFKISGQANTAISVGPIVQRRLPNVVHIIILRMLRMLRMAARQLGIEAKKRWVRV